jgi:hypothetical protein
MGKLFLINVGMKMGMKKSVINLFSECDIKLI